MAVSSGLSLGKISSSVSGLNYAAKQSRLTTTKLSKNIFTGIDKKKKLGSSITLFKRKRIDTKNRKFLIDRLRTAPNIVTKTRGPQTLAITEKSTSLMDRMLGFVGYVSAGWILSNLPTWISLGRQFAGRTILASKILSDYYDEGLEVILDLNKVFSSTFNNLLNFDFTDSSNLVRDSLSELTSSIESLSVGLGSAFEVFLKPFGYVPPLNQPSPYPDAYGNPTIPTSPGGPLQNRATKGTKEQKALLDAISFAEGTTKSYGVVSGGAVNKNLEAGKLTVQQVIDLGNTYKRLGSQHKWSGATGRYQFMPPTLSGLVQRGQLKSNELFTPEKQDEAAIMLIERRGVSANMLKQQGMSVVVSDLLAPEFASFPYSPTGKSYYNQSFKPLPLIQKAYQKSLGSQTTPVTTTSQAPSNVLLNLPSPAAALTNLVNLLTGRPQQKPLSGANLTPLSGLGVNIPVTPFKAGSGAVITSLMGWRQSTQSNHMGYDLAANSGTPIYAYLPGVVTHENRAPGNGPDHGAGYGYWIVWRDDVYGSYHFYGHLMKPAEVKKGDRFQQGALLGYVGSTGRSSGPHLHWEISNNAPDAKGNFSNNQKPDVWLRSHPVTGVKPLATPPTATPSTPLVPPTLTPPPEQEQNLDMQTNQNQLREGIVQERRGQKIIVVDNRGSQMAQKIISSGGGQDITIQVDNYTLLNNFIKNKLLLDLTYL